MHSNLTPTMRAALVTLARDPRKRHPDVLRDGTLEALRRRGLADLEPWDAGDALVPTWQLTDAGRAEAARAMKAGR